MNPAMIPENFMRRSVCDVFKRLSLFMRESNCLSFPDVIEFFDYWHVSPVKNISIVPFCFQGLLMESKSDLW